MNQQPTDRGTQERLAAVDARLKSVEHWVGSFAGSYYNLDKKSIIAATMKSPGFVAENAGFRVTRDGNMETYDGVFRGELHTVVFVKDEVHISNGQLMISDAAKLGRNLGPSATNLFTSQNIDIFPWTNANESTATSTTANKLVDTSGGFTALEVAVNWTVWNKTDNTFALVTAVDSDTQLSLGSDIMVSGESYAVGHGPVVWIRQGGESEFLAIASEARSAKDHTDKTVKKYGVIRDIAAANDPDPSWRMGISVASTKEPGEGWVHFDADSANSPFMDIRYRDDRTWNGWSTKVRVGNLDGVTSAITGITPSGWGIYGENCFFKGDVHIVNGRIFNRLVVGHEIGPGIIMGEDLGGFIVQDTQGRPHMVVDINTGDIRLGYPPDEPCIRIHDGNVEIDAGALKVYSTRMQTFLDEGILDLMSSGNWEDADSTGLRLTSDDSEGWWGIASKKDGTQAARWDVDTGEVQFGPSLKGRINEEGIVHQLDTYDYGRIKWIQGAGGTEIGSLYTYRGSTLHETELRSLNGYSAADILISTQPVSAGNHARVTITAASGAGLTAGWVDDDAQITMRSYPVGYGTNRSYTTIWPGTDGLVVFANTTEHRNIEQYLYPTYLAVFKGTIWTDELQSGLVRSQLCMNGDTVGIDVDRWKEQLDYGGMGVVVDETDAPWLYVRGYPADGKYYKIALTEASV